MWWYAVNICFERMVRGKMRGGEHILSRENVAIPAWLLTDRFVDVALMFQAKVRLWPSQIQWKLITMSSCRR